MTSILIADDHPAVASFIAKGLHAQGYSTRIVTSAHEATCAALDDGFDLMILDADLPGGGLRVLERLRAAGRRIVVLVLGARSAFGEATLALDAGADDYVRTPVRFEELLARIRARLRPPFTPEIEFLEFDGVTLDLRGRRVSVDDETIDLTGREFALLELLMRHDGQLLTRAQIVSHVWGFTTDRQTNVVNVYVAALRKKVGGDSIQAVRGVGYRFCRDRPGASVRR